MASIRVVVDHSTPEFDTGMPNKPEDLDKHASAMWDAVCHALKAVEILREIDEYGCLCFVKLILGGAQLSKCGVTWYP